MPQTRCPNCQSPIDQQIDPEYCAFLERHARKIIEDRIEQAVHYLRQLSSSVAVVLQEAHEQALIDDRGERLFISERGGKMTAEERQLNVDRCQAFEDSISKQILEFESSSGLRVQGLNRYAANGKSLSFWVVYDVGLR